MAKKKINKCICYECEVELDITVLSPDRQKLIPEICPFCGDYLNLRTEAPLLNNFDQLDDFNDEDYYEDDEEDDEDDD